VILVATEGVHLQLREPSRGAVEQDRVFEDFLQEQRVRPVQQGQVDASIGGQRLQVRGDGAEFAESVRDAGEENRDIQIALRAISSRRSGSMAAL
jgi:hypothetical protein